MSGLTYLFAPLCGWRCGAASALLAATRQRVAAAQALMARHGETGVPALLTGEHALPNGPLYGPRTALLAAIA